MAVRTILSKVPVVAAPSHQSRGLSMASEASTSSSLPILSSFLSGRQCSLQIRSPEAANRKSPGMCLAMAGQLSLLSSAEIVDENERLKDAAKTGDLQTLNEILRLGEVSVDLPSSSRAGWTALHLASFYGHLRVVESLLKAGANLEVRNNSGNTPLQLASLKGNISIARVLLESGADFYAESTDKGTALEYAQGPGSAGDIYLGRSVLRFQTLCHVDAFQAQRELTDHVLERLQLGLPSYVSRSKQAEVLLERSVLDNVCSII